MASALKFVVFLGSTREGRLGERVATFVMNQIKNRGHSAVLLDPQELDLPILKKPLHHYQDKSKAPTKLQDLNEKILHSDAILVVSAEYNHSIPPALSNLMDHFGSTSYSWKPSGIVCYSPGPFGGVRSAMQLRAMLGELGCISVSNIFAIPKVHEAVDAKGDPTGVNKDHTVKSCNNLLNQVEWWADAARTKRAQTPKNY